MSAFIKPKRAVSRVFIHCSASDNPAHDNAATMDAWHRARKPPFKEIGYHCFIRKDGSLEDGRSLEKAPAAQEGHNAGTIAICLHGLDEDKFTAAQFDTLRKLCGDINAAYGGRVTFHGHREVANKTCPVFDYRAVLGLDAQGRMGGAAVPGALRRGDRSEDVMVLQRRLIDKAGARLAVDGDFGAKTEAAVIGFQKARGLTADGIVGVKTWAALVGDGA